MHLRFRIPDWILLLALCTFFFLWRLSSFGLIGADEPRYAQVAREMLARHDWVTPTLGGSPWLEKPPLYYWQAMIAYRIFGVSDWVARLPSVFDASLLVFAVYGFMRRFRRAFVLDGAFMLACCAGIVGYARAASTDMPLASMFSIGMIAWFAWLESGKRRCLAAFYGFLALAALAKGPVALLLAALIIVTFAVTQTRASVVWTTASLPGLVVFCALALPWYALVQLRNPQFLRVFILEHNFARFGTNLFHHPEPFWYYVPVTLLGLAPWTAFAAVALMLALRRFRSKDADPLEAFLVTWIVVVVVFFSISRSKLPGYVLPAIPPGVLLLAKYLHERDVARPHRALAALHGAVSAAVLLAAFLLPFALAHQRVAWDRSDIIPMMVVILAGIGVSRAGFQRLRVATAVPAVLALAIALRVSAPVLNGTLSARAVSDALSHVAPSHLPVAAVLVSRETEYGLQFYRNQRIPRYELHQAPAGEHLVVARQGFQKAFARDVPGRRVVYLGNFPEQGLEFFYVSQ